MTTNTRLVGSAAAKRGSRLETKFVDFNFASSRGDTSRNNSQTARRRTLEKLVMVCLDNTRLILLTTIDKTFYNYVLRGLRATITTIIIEQSSDRRQTRSAIECVDSCAIYPRSVTLRSKTSSVILLLNCAQ